MFNPRHLQKFKIQAHRNTREIQLDSRNEKTRDGIPEKLGSVHMVWRPGLWASGGLDTGRLDFGCHECLDSGRLVSWTLDVSTLELLMPGSLDSGWLDSRCLDVWTLDA